MSLFLSDADLIHFLSRIPGTQDRTDYVYHLLQIGRQVPDAKVVVEIGSFLGGSGIALAYACPKADIFCVDPAFAPTRSGYTGVCHHHFRHNALTAGVSDRMHAIGQYSVGVGGFLADFNYAGQPRFDIDLLYIDGEHTYEGVRGDCAWMNRVRPDGLVAFDDWIEPVARAAQECLDGWTLAMPDNFFPRVYRRNV